MKKSTADKKGKYGLLFLTCLLTALLLFPCVRAKSAPPAIKARAAILMDAKTGQVLYEKNSRLRSAPASTTR